MFFKLFRRSIVIDNFWKTKTCQSLSKVGIYFLQMTWKKTEYSNVEKGLNFMSFGNLTELFKHESIFRGHYYLLLECIGYNEIRFDT